MTKGNNPKNSILLCAITVLGITWTGIGYIKWFYGLFDYYSQDYVDISANVVDYGLQAAGVMLFILYIKQYPFALKKALISAVSGLLIFMVAATTVIIAPLKLVLGYVMVIFIGMLTGGYITLLAAMLTDCGLVYGIAAALGGIISLLITLPFDGKLYTGSISTIIYVLISAALAVLVLCILPHDSDGRAEDKSTGIVRKGESDRSLIIHAMLLLFIVCITMNIGNYLPVSYLTSGDVSLEIVRAASTAGLLIAGIVVTKSRQSGLILCICALLSPFLSVVLSQDPTLKLPLYILSYILMGVYGVYCVVLFTDISAEHGLYLAAVGMMTRRAGESVGNGAALLLSHRPKAILILAGALFITAVFTAAAFWRRMYYPSLQYITTQQVSLEVKGKDERFAEFTAHFDISEREQDVLRCVLEGKTNAEIASVLFISENTVKFHIRNILKKSGANNRKELRRLWICANN